jgi:hypothetical protein
MNQKEGQEKRKEKDRGKRQKEANTKNYNGSIS